MIPYDIDQHNKEVQEQGRIDLEVEGLTDGSHGYPLTIKYMHDLTYISAYVIGITRWKDELERRERENYEASLLEF
ncbi:MAG: hypothetical protein F6K58_19810 [Symploca sp. SIO2E9]|nr:hypothetical protein [Symploca sp. SIO2E9]